MTDRELLEHLSHQRSEDSFNEIVRRHIDLVHSAALRQLGNPDTAHDITQNVFILLAKKANQLEPDVILTGWLYRTARNLCLEHIRKDQRRREREQAAADHLMNTTADQWEHVAPELEPAMDELNDAERHAVLLRFFKNKSLRDVGCELGIREDAAQKRVSRALDRLRDIFNKRGVTPSATALATTISGSAVQAAPPVILTAISTAAIGAGLTTATLNSTTTMTSLLNLKTATAILAAAAVTGTSTYIVKEKEADHLRAEYETLNETRDRLANEQQQAVAAVQLRDDQVARLKKDVADLPRLRGEVDKLNHELTAMDQLQTENKKLQTQAAELRNRLQTADTESAPDESSQLVAFEKLKARSTSDLKMLAGALHVYSTDHDGGLPSGLDTDALRKVLMGSRPPLSSAFDPWDYELVCLEDDAIGPDGTRDANTVLVRQRVPMTDPDGNLVKVYALADGSVQTVQESTVGSFEQFERNWTLQHKPIVFELPQR